MSNAKPHASGNSFHPQNQSQPQEVQMNQKSPDFSSNPQKAAEKPLSDASPWNHLADLQRQQFALATECASALFRGVESMRKIQQEAAHQASAHHAAATQQLRSPAQTADLLALLSSPMRMDMEEVQKYWNQLAATSLQAQTEIMSSICRMFNNKSSSSIHSLQEVIQATLPPLASSLFVNGTHERPHQS